MCGLQEKMIYDTDFVQTIFRNHSQSHRKVLAILEGKIPLLIVTMDTPLSSEDIEHALRGVHGFCVVSSYDLLSNLEHGQFIFINTDNVSTQCLRSSRRRTSNADGVPRNRPRTGV